MADPPGVLVVGSLHHDILIEADHLPRRDETAVGRRWYPKFGGKGGNQAVAAARAGASARMCGAVGHDGFGAFLLAGLDAAGVDRRFVARIGGVGSGMSVAVQDAAGDYAATIVSGANLAIDPGLLADDRIWSGMALLVLQNEVPPAVTLAAASEARRRGLRTLLNAAPTRALPPDLPGLIDLLIVNSVEAAMMGTAPVTDLATALDTARSLSSMFRGVIVTAGAQGLAASTPEGEFSLPASKVRVVSSHGAGDAFIGTLAAELAKGESLIRAATRASDAAAVHVARPSPVTAATAPAAR